MLAIFGKQKKKTCCVTALLSRVCKVIRYVVLTMHILKIGTQCVHVSAIRKLLLDMLLSYTVQNVGFVGFVWCQVCFAALKINETIGKKI